MNRYREINATRTLPKKEHVYAIYCRLEEDGDVVSGENVETTETDAVLNFEVVGLSSFRDIQKSFRDGGGGGGGHRR